MYIERITEKHQNMIKIKNIKNIFLPNFSNIEKNIKKNILYFFDLTNFHIFEQLILEESLYRFSNILTEEKNNIAFIIINNTVQNQNINNNTIQNQNINNNTLQNKNKCVIFGISGKVNDFIKDKNYIKKNNIILIKRYTGGGTVYVNNNCLFVSLILPHHFAKSYNSYDINIKEINRNSIFKLNPGNIAEWCFHHFYGKFLKTNNVVFNKNFFYLENDFVTKIYKKNTENVIFKKIGGNAQAFSKNYFVQHTSFIWSCNIDEMKHVLINPFKQPKYRQNRSHENFIESIKTCLHQNIITPDCFIKNMIHHIRQIINEKNKMETYFNKEKEYWFFNKINLGNEHNDNTLLDPFDYVYNLDINLLKELINLYNNNNNICSKNIRTTTFLDYEGNKVSDKFYNIKSYLI